MKKNITPRNNKKQAHGLWIYYLPDGNLWFKGHFINDIRHGHFIHNWVHNRNIVKSQITFYLK